MPRWLLVTSLVTISAVEPYANGQTPPAPEAPKFAKVSGVVVDAADGRVLRRATVCITPDSNRHYCNETDLQGRFTLADLPPARYSFSIERVGYFAADPITDQLSSLTALKAGDELTGIKLHMHRAGSIFGRVVFDDGEPFPGAELRLDRNSGALAKTNDSGEYRFDNLSPGDYRVQLNRPNINRNCDSSQSRKERLYVPRGANAEYPAVHIDFGQEMHGPEIVMVERMPRRIAGRVVWDSSAGDRYSLPGVWFIVIGNDRVRVNNVDGLFAACGLAPGEYTLRADARIVGHRVAGDLKIRIEDEDLKDLEINVESSASIRARIQVEDNAPLDLAKADVLTIQDHAFPYNTFPQPNRQPDGSYVIDEVYSGEYRFVLSPLPSGSYLKSAQIDGRDVIESPLLVHAGEQLDGLLFTVSLKAGILTGVVQDEMGNPVPNALVMLQPDPRHGDIDIHLCNQTTDQNGAFTCDNLAPGKYQAAAWRTFPDIFPAWNEIATRGTSVDVSESGRPTIVLNVPK